MKSKALTPMIESESFEEMAKLIIERRCRDKELVYIYRIGISFPMLQGLKSIKKLGNIYFDTDRYLQYGAWYILSRSKNDEYREHAEEYLIASANKGHPVARVELAVRWASSKSDDKRQKALVSILKAADQKFPPAIYGLSVWYLYGKPGLVAQDCKKGVELLLRAAQMDVIAACSLLGALYVNGVCQNNSIILPADPEKAISYLNKSNCLATFHLKLGEIYLKGVGKIKTKPDSELARKHYNQGLALARKEKERLAVSHLKLGEIYLRGVGKIKPDIELARKHYNQVLALAKKEGKVNYEYQAQGFINYIDGINLLSQDKYLQAEACFKKACVLYNNDLILVALGKINLIKAHQDAYRIENFRQYCTKGGIYFEQAFAKGNAMAAEYLGFMSETGYGIARDFSKAAKYYQKAIEYSGGRFGHRDMGRLYEFGMGVQQNELKAIEHYENAILHEENDITWKLLGAFFISRSHAYDAKPKYTLSIYDNTPLIAPPFKLALICFNQAQRLKKEKPKENVARSQDCLETKMMELNSGYAERAEGEDFYIALRVQAIKIKDLNILLKSYEYAIRYAEQTKNAYFACRVIDSCLCICMEKLQEVMTDSEQNIRHIKSGSNQYIDQDAKKIDRISQSIRNWQRKYSQLLSNTEVASAINNIFANDNNVGRTNPGFVALDNSHMGTTNTSLFFSGPALPNPISPLRIELPDEVSRIFTHLQASGINELLLVGSAVILFLRMFLLEQNDLAFEPGNFNFIAIKPDNESALIKASLSRTEHNENVYILNLPNNFSRPIQVNFIKGTLIDALLKMDSTVAALAINHLGQIIDPTKQGFEDLSFQRWAPIGKTEAETYQSITVDSRIMLRVCKAIAYYFRIDPRFVSAVRTWVTDETSKLSKESSFKSAIARELLLKDENFIYYFVINLIQFGVLQKALGIEEKFYSEKLLNLLCKSVNIQKISEDESPVRQLGY